MNINIVFTATCTLLAMAFLLWPLHRVLTTGFFALLTAVPMLIGLPQLDPRLPAVGSAFMGVLIISTFLKGTLFYTIHTIGGTAEITFNQPVSIMYAGEENTGIECVLVSDMPKGKIEYIIGIYSRLPLHISHRPYNPSSERGYNEGKIHDLSEVDKRRASEAAAKAIAS